NAIYESIKIIPEIIAYDYESDFVVSDSKCFGHLFATFYFTWLLSYTGNTTDLYKAYYVICDTN
ncbi:MAG: hypothetical protein PHU66_01985, partial [Bacteroidaceae bacterium]|nr:hypothetical protein [Bacteroidaceae bacterium]